MKTTKKTAECQNTIITLLTYNRKIFGPICVAGYWRSRTNEEVRQLYGGLGIVTEIKKKKMEMTGTCGEDE